jgi:hypothetical protein
MKPSCGRAGIGDSQLTRAGDAHLLRGAHDAGGIQHKRPYYLRRCERNVVR